MNSVTVSGDRSQERCALKRSGFQISTDVKVNNSSPLVTVIVPVFNESSTVDQLLKKLVAADPCDKEIIVVDDGSNDGTADSLHNWRSHLNVLIIRHALNRGKGAAIRTGLSYARGKYVIIQDADLEYDPSDYSALLAPLMSGRAKIVFGSRYHKSSVRAGRPIRLFRAGVSILNFGVWAIYGRWLTDEATCYKVMDSEILRQMNLQCERFEFCPEVTAKACRMGLEIVEVPIHYCPRGTSAGKKIRLSDGLSAMMELWKWRAWRPDLTVADGQQEQS